MKTFENEWIFQRLEDHPSYISKRMFGGLAAWLFGRLMLILVEPTRTGRWKWHGALICTSREHHAAIVDEFPCLEPHAFLRKWLYIDSHHDDFESTMERIADLIAQNDRRFGVRPEQRQPAREQRDKFSRSKPRT
jgi:hypothetical protein